MDMDSDFMNRNKELFFNLAGTFEDDNYSWITDKIAIGSHISPYPPFQIIVNMNYPYNGAIHNLIQRKKHTFDNRHYIIYTLGINDDRTFSIVPILTQLLSLLRDECETHKGARILFHCFAGKSRSVAAALAYLVEIDKMKYEDALSLVKEKRPLVAMNIGFQKELETFYGEDEIEAKV